MGKKKRDRWDSSSEDEDENEKDNVDNHAAVASGPSAPPSSTMEKRRYRSSDDRVDSSLPAAVFASAENATRGKEEEEEEEEEGGDAIVGTRPQSSPNIDISAAAASHQHHRRRRRLPKHNPLLHGCRSVYYCYERLARLDEGTYGVVWKARDMATDEVVALKQIKFDSAMTKEGFPMTALREISVLLDLCHECIVTVREMVVGDAFDKVFMVMEYMEMDLKEALSRSGHSPFPQSELKNVMYQILSATDHIHQKWYVHRDIKTSNVLVHRSGKIALCDFGLARKYQMPLKAMTQMVITLWYRPPELLFGESVYGPEVDMWSIGCIFGELLKKEPMLQGRGELDQVDKIFKLLGAPDDQSWPGFRSLPNSGMFRWKTGGGSSLGKVFPANTFTGGQTYLDSNGLDLLAKLLTLDPRRRISADEAIDHSYFKEGVERQTPRFVFD